MATLFPSRVGEIAVVVVDMQRYFTEPGHPFSRLSAIRVEGGIAGYFKRLETVVIPNIVSVLQALRVRARPVFFTQLGSCSPAGRDLPAWARRLNDSGRAAFGAAVLPSFDDPSADIDPRLAPVQGDRTLRKTTTGAIASTPLETELRDQGVTAVVIAGVLTPFCVTQTARELADRNFDVAILDDATASLTEAAHTAALAAFSSLYGWVLSTDEFVRRLDRPGS